MTHTLPLICSSCQWGSLQQRQKVWLHLNTRTHTHTCAKKSKLHGATSRAADWQDSSSPLRLWLVVAKQWEPSRVKTRQRGPTISQLTTCFCSLLPPFLSSLHQSTSSSCAPPRLQCCRTCPKDLTKISTNQRTATAAASHKHLWEHTVTDVCCYRPWCLVCRQWKTGDRREDTQIFTVTMNRVREELEHLDNNIKDEWRCCWPVIFLLVFDQINIYFWNDRN